MNQFLEAALNYASLRWKVFPLAPGQKIPLTSHGCKDATDDEDEIRHWWAKWPNANVAVACGENSGVYVIDVDVTASGDINGIESLGEFPPLPDTVRQDTPRGGFHAFFKSATPPANRNSFRPGIDIRGTGYYVVLSPSIHPNGGKYTWTKGREPWECLLAEYPDFMRPVVRAPWATPALATALPCPQTAPQALSDDAQRRASLYLAQCDPAVQGQGGHDKLLWAAVAMVHGFLLSDSQAFDLLSSEYNPRCVPPWDFGIPAEEKDFRRKINQARKLTPQNQPGWLINDPAYAPIDTSGIDVQSLLSLVMKQGLPKINLDECIQHPALEKPSASELRFLVRPTGLLGEICGWINATSLKEQPFLTLACVLSFLGVLFGRKIRDTLGSRTNLYCMGIAQSSAGKAHAMNQIRRLCEAAGCTKLLGGDDIASDSAIEDRVSREPATLFMWDEIGHLLAHIKSGVSKHHAQVVSLLMKLYSAAGNIYLGREYAEQEKQREIVQPCCCIYGTSTPERFTGGISPGELQDGWLSRCLVFYSQDNPIKSRGRSEIPVPTDITAGVNAWYLRKVGDVETDGHSISQFVANSGNLQPPQQIIVPTSIEAERMFIDFDNETTEYGKGHPLLACLWAKGEENARRIALIVSAGDNFDSPAITPAIADYSCRLIRFLLNDFGLRIAPEIVSSETESKKRKIVNIIKGYGVLGCSTRDVIRATQWARDPRDRNNLLADLMETEEIVVVPNVGKKGARYWTPETFPKVQP